MDIGGLASKLKESIWDAQGMAFLGIRVGKGE